MADTWYIYKTSLILSRRLMILDEFENEVHAIPLKRIVVASSDNFSKQPSFKPEHTSEIPIP